MTDPRPLAEFQTDMLARMWSLDESQRRLLRAAFDTVYTQGKIDAILRVPSEAAQAEVQRDAVAAFADARINRTLAK